jgi:hypothetical protein
MGLAFVLALLAFICAVIGGAMAHTSYPHILVAVGVVLLAVIHLIGGTAIGG